MDQIVLFHWHTNSRWPPASLASVCTTTKSQYNPGTPPVQLVWPLTEYREKSMLQYHYNQQFLHQIEICILPVIVKVTQCPPSLTLKPFVNNFKQKFHVAVILTYSRNIDKYCH